MKAIIIVISYPGLIRDRPKNSAFLFIIVDSMDVFALEFCLKRIAVDGIYKRRSGDAPNL